MVDQRLLTKLNGILLAIEGMERADESLAIAIIAAGIHAGNEDATPEHVAKQASNTWHELNKRREIRDERK